MNGFVRAAFAFLPSILFSSLTAIFVINMLDLQPGLGGVMAASLFVANLIGSLLLLLNAQSIIRAVGVALFLSFIVAAVLAIIVDAWSLFFAAVAVACLIVALVAWLSAYKFK